MDSGLLFLGRGVIVFLAAEPLAAITLPPRYTAVLPGVQDVVSRRRMR